MGHGLSLFEEASMQQADPCVRLLQRLLDRGLRQGAFAMLAMCLDLEKFEAEEANAIAAQILVQPIDVWTLPDTYPRPSWKVWIGHWEHAFRCYVADHPTAIRA